MWIVRLMGDIAVNVASVRQLRAVNVNNAINVDIEINGKSAF